MKNARVGVVGATGYSGAIAARLIATHPNFDLAFCTSDQRAGEPVSRWLGVAAPPGLTYAPNAEAASLATSVDAVILATSAEVSSKLAPIAFEANRVVVDLSGAFRLAGVEDYTRWYGFPHPRPDLLARAHYGLPELFGAPKHVPGEPLLISNPGCYATAALLAIAPLVRAGLVAPRGIIVDAKSGVTGAGRQAKEEYSFTEIDEDLRAYRLLSHQHTPEIVRWTERAASRNAGDVSLTFTPHLLPIKRGILATTYARPEKKLDPQSYVECIERAYRGCPFIEVVPPGQVTLTSVVGTNRVRIGVIANDDVVIVVSSLDNLLKGASGQAVQNLNRVFGIDEGAGLSFLHRSAP